MTLTVVKYEETLTKFSDFMAQHAGQLRSVMLYGSMARGEIVPGHSDLDFWVFVKQELFSSEARFSQLLRNLTEAARILADSGLPVIHAFCYYADDELGWLPQALVPNLSESASGRVIVGDEIASKLSSTEASKVLYQQSYFGEMRRQVFLPLTIFLGRENFSEQEAKAIFGGLKYVKYVPEAACAALNLWPGEQAATMTLVAAMPNIDMGIVAEVLDHRLQGDYLTDSKQLAQLLMRSLIMIEAIYWQLVEQQQGSL